MQILHLLDQHNKVYGIREENYSEKAYYREKKLELFLQLKQQGGHDETILKALDISRATIYRYKKRYEKNGLEGLEPYSRSPNKKRSHKRAASLIQQVLNIRKQNPLYGKYKIAAILKRDWNVIASVSTIGRIISDLIKRSQIKPAFFYYARRMKKSRIFNSHAQRWKCGMKAKIPGDLLQIDHMTVSITSTFSVKHFQAICPITKMVVEQAYSSATSNVASKFLDYIHTKLPFKVLSIQVDGGSEFMGEFEAKCQKQSIPLYVLPPRSPEYNGTVERANGAAKFEFYYLYQGYHDLTHLRKKLDTYVRKYNGFRPHQALRYKTPMEYYQKNGGPQSHML